MKNLGTWRPWRRLSLVAMTAMVLLGLLVPAVTVGADALSFRGEYYNNVNLTGAPVLVRDDATINFDWGSGAPDAAVNADGFSVRWSAYLMFNAGDYTFHASSDDGVRVWVDDQLLIDQWHDHPVQTYDATKYLAAGYHSIRVEHYENTGDAVCKFWWEQGGASTTPVTDWRGEYFVNQYLGGTPTVVRNDAAVNFDWGYGSPAAGIPTDHFSVRWERTLYFGGGTYTFSATVDDGVRVYVDGALVVDKWYAQSRTTHTGSIYLAPGNHTVRVEYFESSGVAVCMVSWSGGGGDPAAAEIIVDDRDSGFVWGGNSYTWYGRDTGYRSHLYWAWNNWQKTVNWGKWIPSLPSAGTWDVYVYIPNRYHGTKSASYEIHYQGGSTTRVVNQNNYNNAWVSLGSYYFDGGSDEYVYLSNATGETYRTRFVGYDAIKFVRQGAAPPPPYYPPSPSGCAIDPVLGFGRVWYDNPTVKSKLGCPTQTEQSTWAGEQPFQGGLMFWRQDIKDIYVLYNNGTWAGYDDTWVTGMPESDPSIVPPYGYYQPVRGFGKVWRENAAVRNGLAWATTEELGFHGSMQSFDGGMMLWSNTRGIYVMYNDGTWERYN